MTPNNALILALLSMLTPVWIVTSIILAEDGRELTMLGKLIASPGILCIKLADKLPSVYKEEGDS